MADQQTFRVQLPDGQLVEVEASSREEAARAAARFSGARASEATASQSDFITRGQVPQAIEAAVVQAAPSATQLPMAAANLASRVDPRNYDWSQGYRAVVPGSGAYDAPLPTREEFMGGIARRTGDERYVWQGGTPESRLVQGVVSAGLEGGLTAAAVRGGPMAFRAGRNMRAPSRTETGFLARDVAASGGVDAAATATGIGLAEVTGNPYVGMAGGLATGQVGSSAFFGRGPSGDVRRALSDLSEDDIRYARTVLQAAQDEGISLTGMDAIALASATTGPELVGLYRQAVNLLGEGDPASRVRRRNVGTGARGGEFDTGQFGEALRRFQRERLGVEGVPDQEAAAIGAQGAASSAVDRARVEARRVYGPMYRQLEQSHLPDGFVQAARDRIMRRAETQFGPESAEMREIERLTSELDGMTTQAQFENWRQGFYARTSRSSPDTVDPISSRVGGALGREMQVLDRYLQTQSANFRDARRSYAQSQQEIVDPVVRAVGGIADRNGRSTARQVVRAIVEDTDMEPGVLRRGFGAIAEQDPEAASQLLSMYIQRQFDTSFSSNAGAGGRPRLTAGGDWHARMFGNETNVQNLRAMFNTVDEARDLPSGTSFTAFSRLMDLAQASGQNRASGVSGLGPAMGEQMESGRLTGGATQFATDISNIPVVGNLIGRRIALAMYRGEMDRIIDQLTRTGPGSVDNVLRLAESRFGSRAMMQAAIPLITQANIQEAAVAREEQQ